MHKGTDGAKGQNRCHLMEEMDCYVGVRGSDNVSELSDVPSEKMAIYERYYSTPVHHDVRVKKPAG